MKYTDYTGRRFGRLVVLRKASQKSGNAYKWECLCDCGNKKYITIGNLIKGDILSCGCYRSEKMSTHRMTGTKTYKAWNDMLQRCENVNHPSYPRYGGRGVAVCSEWHSFEAFYADMGKAPKGLTLDRIDNDGGYTPDNCRWTTSTEQANNTQRNTYYSYNGESLTLTQWCRQLNLSYEMVRGRIRRGWTIEKALTTPVKK